MSAGFIRVTIGLACGVLIAIAGAGAVRWSAGAGPEPLRAPAVKRIDLPALCPWREPEVDMPRFFPGATEHRPERKVLTARWRQLRDRLGTPPTPTETVLDRHSVLAPDGRTVGYALLRRIPGEYGAVEVAIGVDGDGRITGLKVQREREPAMTAQLLHSGEWARLFVGRQLSALPDPEAAMTSIPPAARRTASAVVSGIRTALVLQEEALLSDDRHHH